MTKQKSPVAVFDLDNTLIDSKAKLNSDTIQAFERLDPSISPEEVIAQWDELGSWYKVAEKYGFSREEFDTEFDKRETWGESLEAGKVKIFEDTYETLDALKEQGQRLAVLSKSIPEYTMKKLDYFNLTPYFDSVRTVHPKEPSKRQGALEVIADLDPETISKAYFIGDKEEDVKVSHDVSEKYNISTGGIYVNRQGKQLPGYHNTQSLKQILEII